MPKGTPTILKGRKDRLSWRFFVNFYARYLSNGETCDRNWLVYSAWQSLLFCCKIFKKGQGKLGKGQLVTECFNDWSYLGTRLKEHETITDHLLNMTTWCDLRYRFQQNETIDKIAQEQRKKEREY